MDFLWSLFKVYKCEIPLGCTPEINIISYANYTLRALHSIKINKNVLVKNLTNLIIMSKYN